MGQLGSVFNSECPKYHYCSYLLGLSILRNENYESKITKFWSRKDDFFFTIDAVYAHRCASAAHRCASAKIGAWPTLVFMLCTELVCKIECLLALQGSSDERELSESVSLC